MRALRHQIPPNKRLVGWGPNADRANDPVTDEMKIDVISTGGFYVPRLSHLSLSLSAKVISYLQALAAAATTCLTPTR